MKKTFCILLLVLALSQPIYALAGAGPSCKRCEGSNDNADITLLFEVAAGYFGWALYSIL